MRTVVKVGLGIVLGGILLVAGCAAIIGIGLSGSEGGPSVEEGSGGSGGGKQKTARVGDKLTLKGTTYEVTDVSEKSSIGDKSIGLDEKANGVFVVVKLELTNRKDEPATILEDNIRVIGGNGKNYSVSDDAIFALDDQSFAFEEIQPDNTESGSLVYDIPENATSGAKLQVEDLFSSEKGQIRLGL
jgi:hypothetical protein